MARANAAKTKAMNNATSAVMHDGMEQAKAAALYGVKLPSLRNRLCYLRKEPHPGKGMHPALMLFKEVHHG